MNDTEQHIRERAYRIWLDEGCPEGREGVHWDIAAAQLASETPRSQSERPERDPEPTLQSTTTRDMPQLSPRGEEIVRTPLAAKTEARDVTPGEGLRGSDKQQDALRDERSGAYDKGGQSQGFDAGEGKRTEHQRAQTGADVRQGSTKRNAGDTDPAELPEGLLRPRQGPYSKTTGRGTKKPW